MKAYKRKYHAEYWSSDIKPKGRIRRAIEGSVRMRADQEIRRELDCSSEVSDNRDDSRQED